jgi:hypothetical protein
LQIGAQIMISSTHSEKSSSRRVPTHRVANAHAADTF